MVGIELHKNNGRLFRADQDQNNGDDFGLPGTGGTGGGSSTPKPSGTPKKPVPPPKKSSAAPAIIIIIIVLVVIAVLVYWFVFRQPVKKPVVVPKPDTTAIQAPPDTVVSKPVEVAPPPEPTTGQIDTIVSRTGRYYVIISASIDDDLALDYAKKLSAQGVSCKVLGSPDKRGYHQLSVADFDNRQDALAKADELKGTYGDNIWVMKY
jgi:hypothetical protein